MKTRTKLIAAIAASLAMTAAAAVAGSPIYGYGSTRAGAADEANRKAEDASQSRFKRRDCYTAVRPSDCKEDGNGWICVAYVANHQGSCGL